MDPEYTVIGRVARRIWADCHARIAMERVNEVRRLEISHIQTSGRSLHAQEISFNDIRTTLTGVDRSL